ncbi:hypothetical protein MMPV_006371 [Pyropia vietnamensis]
MADGANGGEAAEGVTTIPSALAAQIPAGAPAVATAPAPWGVLRVADGVLRLCPQHGQEGEDGGHADGAAGGEASMPAMAGPTADTSVPSCTCGVATVGTALPVGPTTGCAGAPPDCHAAASDVALLDGGGGVARVGRRRRLRVRAAAAGHAVQWDEANLAENKREADRAPRMKIPEPPTPFRYGSASDAGSTTSGGSAPPSPPASSAAALAAAARGRGGGRSGGGRGGRTDAVSGGAAGGATDTPPFLDEAKLVGFSSLERSHAARAGSYPSSRSSGSLDGAMPSPARQDDEEVEKEKGDKEPDRARGPTLAVASAVAAVVRTGGGSSATDGLINRGSADGTADSAALAATPAEQGVGGGRLGPSTSTHSMDADREGTASCSSDSDDGSERGPASLTFAQRWAAGDALRPEARQPRRRGGAKRTVSIDMGSMVDAAAATTVRGGGGGQGVSLAPGTADVATSACGGAKSGGASGEKKVFQAKRSIHYRGEFLAARARAAAAADSSDDSTSSGG